MIVLLPKSPGGGGRVGAERGRGLVTQPGVRHLLRGPLLLVPSTGTDPTDFFQSLSFIREAEPRDFSMNSGSDLLVQVNLRIPTSKTRCDYKAFVCFSFRTLFLFSGSEVE